MTGFTLDGVNGRYTALMCVNGKIGADVPGAVAGKQVNDSGRHDLEITVRLNGQNTNISTMLDGRPQYQWTGPIAALSQYSPWATTPPGSLALGTNTARWVVSEVMAKRL
jgi:hypothetical protein